MVILPPKTESSGGEKHARTGHARVSHQNVGRRDTQSSCRCRIEGIEHIDVRDAITVRVKVWGAGATQDMLERIEFVDGTG